LSAAPILTRSAHLERPLPGKRGATWFSSEHVFKRFALERE
jgi:hypothetical protein